MLEDRFEDGLESLYVEQHHHGDGALDGPDIPVLTIVADKFPFPGFGSLRANKLFVCPPKTGGRSLAILDLARNIRNQVAAKATEQTDIVIRQGEVIAIHGAKLFMDSAWLGSDKAPFLWFPRAELPRVQDVDPRASVRVFHATQLIFSRYAAAATIFFRVFRTGDSIGLDISMTTLAPVFKGMTEFEARLSRHKFAKHKGSRRGKSSQRSSPADELLEYQNAPNIQELKALSSARWPGRRSEDQVIWEQSADNRVLWPGSNQDVPPTFTSSTRSRS